MPEGEDIENTQQVFENCGLAGFVSNMDVVHIRYDKGLYMWARKAIPLLHISSIVGTTDRYCGIPLVAFLGTETIRQSSDMTIS